MLCILQHTHQKRVDRLSMQTPPTLAHSHTIFSPFMTSVFLMSMAKV